MAKTTFTCIIVGTGFSGLAMAIKLKEKGIHDFIILEKANEVGGTWRENTYPGAECDIPSALYSYSFEPNPNWKYKWSMQPQILEYIKYVAKKYDLNQHIHFQQELVAAKWEESTFTWTIKTKDESSFQTKTLVSAIGQLHHPSTPDFKGKNLFKKDNWHSAQWNHDVDLEEKTVGVIGNAASAVQFIPEIAKMAKQVVIFQRSANWMLPKQDRPYFEWEKKLVAKLPILLRIYRLYIWLMGGALFFLMKNKNNLIRKFYQFKVKKYIKNHIKDPEVVQQLIPKYPFGAKRVLFSDSYYPTLARPNLKLVVGGVQEISKNGVIGKNGLEHPLDILIYATGFKSNPFLLGLDIQGRNEISIQEHWKAGPKNYLGMTVNNFPNLFIMYGPNTNLGHNSIILMSEAQANYIAQCIYEIKNKNWKAIEVKEEVINTYHQSIQKRLKAMIWNSIEDSWYKSANGNIPNNYPGRTMEYMRDTKKVNINDFKITI